MTKTYGVADGDVLANGRYRVLELVGEGASSQVFRVHDLELDDSEVALKVLSLVMSHDCEMSRRFERECRIVRKLSHSAIPNLYDFGVLENGRRYLAQKFVRGNTLDYYIREDSLSLFEKLYILQQLADVLGYAHSHEIAHRDVKPENLIIGEECSLTVTDFGVSKDFSSNANDTATQQSIGTPYYMAPEQLDAKFADSRADIYSLGIIAFELICGEVPFTGDWARVMADHVSSPLPWQKAGSRVVPAWYREMVNRCTAKSAKERYQNMNEVRDLLTAQLMKEPKFRELAPDTHISCGALETIAKSGSRSSLAYVLAGAAASAAVLTLAGFPGFGLW